MSAKQTLFEFLEDQLPAYENPQGVQVYMNTDSTLIVCSDFPGTEQTDHVSLELLQEVKTYNKLTALLKITNLEQLLKLSPDHLLALYERGRMNIVCMLEGHHEMRFLKYKNCIWAKSIDKEIHQVAIPLSQAEDYINYTSQYYSKGNTATLPPPPIPYNTNLSLIYLNKRD